METSVLLLNKLQENGNILKCPIAVIMRDDKVLAGHRHYTKDKWKDVSVWTLPGGRCDEGESIEQALRREVTEEVGITDFEIIALIDEVEGAKEGDIVPIFFCTTSQEATLMEPEKFSEWKWVPRDEYIAIEKYSGFNPVARMKIVEFLKQQNIS